MTTAPLPITPRPPRKVRSSHAQRLAHVVIAAQDAGLGSLALSLQNIGRQIDAGLSQEDAGKILRERANYCRSTALALQLIADDLNGMLEVSDG